MSTVSARYRRKIAERLLKDNRAICEAWLERLDSLLPVAERDIFPTAKLLDHIPALIAAMADELACSSALDVSISALVTKATELGELRYKQEASVHQLLREYEHLAELLNEFVIEVTRDLPFDVSPIDALTLNEELNGAIRVLMRTTIDTFTEKYAATIDEQHERLCAFNRMASHELRTPMHSLRFAAQVLHEEAQSDGGSSRAAELVIDGVKRIEAVLDGMERASDWQADAPQNPARQEIDLNALVADVIGDLAELIEELEVAVHVDDGMPMATVDFANVSVVLANLISNAVKYSDPDKSQRWVAIKAMSDAGNGRIKLSIADNGVGIPEAELRRIFARDYRATNAAGLNRPGSGLGLYIVRCCLDAMGGDIDIRSSPGNGTVVYVEFDAERTHDGPATAGN